MAGNYGYDTYLVADAIATFDKVGMTGERYDGELIHQTALASLKDEFATIVDKAELLAMLKPPMTAPPASLSALMLAARKPRGGALIRKAKTGLLFHRE